MFALYLGKETSVQALPRTYAKGGATARRISHNAAESAVLIQTDADGGSYDLVNVPRDPFAGSASGKVQLRFFISLFAY